MMTLWLTIWLCKWCQDILHWQTPPATLVLMMIVELQSDTGHCHQLIWVVRMIFSVVSWVVFSMDLVCLILILQFACHQFNQYIFTWYLNWCTYNIRLLFFKLPAIYYAPFQFYHLNVSLPFIPVCFLTRVSDILLVPICLSFTLFPGCLRDSD